jgi:predicted ribosomally synthesized peptide with nif11-like leader
MSIEKAKEYLVKLTESEEAARKADEAHVKALLDLSGEMGFELEERDLREAMDEMCGLGELSEEDLEAVAGGYVSSGFLMLRRSPFRFGW